MDYKATQIIGNYPTCPTRLLDYFAFSQSCNFLPLPDEAVPKYDPNNELFVRREDFDRIFAKAVSKATFHRWVAEEKIKKARDLDGWYLLNKTLVHQGMQPVDVTEFRKERQALTREAIRPA